MATEQTPLLPPSDDARLKPTVAIGIICTWIATFLAAADSTVTSTLSATIAHEFNSTSLVSWLGTGYLIGLTATQPLSGKLSDIFGRRETFCFASVMFTIGNLTCGLSQSRPVIIVARVVTGIGGGGCISLTTFILSDNIPLRSRGFWQGFTSIWYTAGMGLGAVIGGAVHDAFGWRWAFIGIAPISFITGIGVAVFVPDQRSQEQGFRTMLSRVDFSGSLTLVASLVLLLIGLNHEGDRIVTTTFAIAVPLGLVLLGAFLLVEWRWAKEPIIPMSAFRNRTVVAVCLTAWFASMNAYAIVYYVPLYFQSLGLSTSRTGVYLLPDGVGSGLGSCLVGLVIGFTGKYGFFRYSMPFLMFVGAVGFSSATEQTHWVLPEIYLFCKGFGMGGSVTTLILALLHAVPHEQHATTTSAYYAFRSTGCTIGLSVASAIFTGRLNEHRAATGSVCNPGESCYADALHRTFVAAAGFAIAGLASSFFVRAYDTKGEYKSVQKPDWEE
ncbi:Major facilitator superfamily domain general substrate transporter [Penicillium chermesinum]|uniref:MFS-type drug efflux transporter P55 n=1 Tax=Penicillium chermesinum TaxID=63820 RepID=A0A9W9PIG1_9EURO|nr:Major facilitator superfamily domain general substrate transporter [Penicillium chermesinum]KAJ5246752.1 Major facilitator superfamily domain general substrate transporter [Penicillium chermesinum]